MKYLPYFPLLIGMLILCFSCKKKDLFKHNKNLSMAENFQLLADNYVADGIPGMVFLIDHPDHGFHIIESGMASTENQVPITKDHLFHSASLMKIYTAVCIMQLEDAGNLSINDRISAHLPTQIIQKIPNGEDATILSLLNHSSGIPDFAAQEDYLADLIAFTEGGPPPNDELDYIQHLNPDFQVGNRHNYSNTGPYILQQIVTEVTGIPFEDYLLQNIIQKIGLTTTYYKNLPQPVDYTNVPQYYIDWEDNGQLSNSSNLENLATQTFEGFSGLLATIEDYHKFTKALFVDQTLVSSTSLTKMQTINHTSGFGYGTGLEVILSSKFPDKYGHKGGTQASLFYYPDEQAIVISLLNYSFNTGESPFDKKAIATDEIGKNKNLIGEIEICLFD